MPNDLSNASAHTSSRQFGLRDVFVVLTVLAIVLGIFVQAPRPTLKYAIRTAPALIFFSAVYSLLPLFFINLIASGIAWITPAGREVPPHLWRLRWWAPHRLLWHGGAAQAPLFRSAIPIAITSTFVVVILWPFLREFGLAVAVTLSSGTAMGWQILAGLPRLTIDISHLWRIVRWEFWSMLRWWLLFGTWATVWLAVAWPLRLRWKLESPSECFRRLLAFAPWLVVLEIAFLVGVWTESAMTVPEPSTGFVEGIFSWDLWHWDCWKGSTWINRGLLSTWIVASLFARYVLRWRWSAAIAAAACVVPVALDLSVAWTVLHSYSLR